MTKDFKTFTKKYFWSLDSEYWNELAYDYEEQGYDLYTPQDIDLIFKLVCALKKEDERFNLCLCGNKKYNISKRCRKCFINNNHGQLSRSESHQRRVAKQKELKKNEM